MSVSFRQLASVTPQVIDVPAAAFDTLTTNIAVPSVTVVELARNPHQRSPVAPTSPVQGGPASSSADRPWNTSDPVGGAAAPAVLPEPPVLPPAPPPPPPPVPVLPPETDPPMPAPPSDLDEPPPHPINKTVAIAVAVGACRSMRASLRRSAIRPQRAAGRKPNTRELR